MVKKQKVDATNGAINVSREVGKVLYNPAVILEGHTDAVYSAEFNHEGNLIASGGGDKLINVWKLPVDEEDESINLGSVQGHKSAITSIRWLADDIELASASADMTVAVWDLASGKKVKTCKNNSIINEIAYNDLNKDIIATADDNGSVNLWDRRQKQPVLSIHTKYPVLTCTLSNSGSNIYFSGIDPKVNAYDIRNGEEALWTCSGPIDSITSLSINHDDSMLVSRSTRGSVNTYNAKDVIPESVLRPSPYIFDGAPSNSEYKLIRTCFSKDSVHIFSGSDDKTVTMWDVSSRRVLNKFSGHEGLVLGVSVHPTERIVLSTSLDGTVIVREY